MSVLRFCFVFILLTPVLAYSTVLENPAPGSHYSGVGVISGWKCAANGPLTVRFNEGDPISLVYGSERPDVREAGACPSAAVGFVAIWNWANLSAGEHTAVVYDSGIEFARSTFRVESLGTEFLRGATGESVVRNFPNPNTDVVLRWEEPIQQFVVAQVSDGGAAAGQCCRWLHLDCPRGYATEREYSWRNGQVAAGACVASPQDDTGLVALVQHTVDYDHHEEGRGSYSSADQVASWCVNMTEHSQSRGWIHLGHPESTYGGWGEFWPGELEFVMGPYECGARLESFVEPLGQRVHGVALDGRLFIRP